MRLNLVLALWAFAVLPSYGNELSIPFAPASVDYAARSQAWVEPLARVVRQAESSRLAAAQIVGRVGADCPGLQCSEALLLRQRVEKVYAEVQPHVRKGAKLRWGGLADLPKDLLYVQIISTGVAEPTDCGLQPEYRDLSWPRLPGGSAPWLPLLDHALPLVGSSFELRHSLQQSKYELDVKGATSGQEDLGEWRTFALRALAPEVRVKATVTPKASKALGDWAEPWDASVGAAGRSSAACTFVFQTLTD